MPGCAAKSEAQAWVQDHNNGSRRANLLLTCLSGDLKNVLILSADGTGWRLLVRQSVEAGPQGLMS